MKKHLFPLLIAAALCLTGCSSNTPEATTPPAAEPTPTETAAAYTPTPEAASTEALPTGTPEETPAPPTESAPPAEETPAAADGITGAVEISLEDFHAAADGIWVYLSTADWMQEPDFPFFDFCQFSTDGLWFAVYPGGGSRTGRVIKVVQENNIYTITLHYPAEQYMGDDYPESYEDLRLTIADGILTFVDDESPLPWAYMGSTLDEAIPAVAAYLQS